VLSVVVRWGPVRTVVNGTLVARPSRMTPVPGGAVGSQPGPRARSVRRNHHIVGSRERGAAASSVPVVDALDAPVLRD
jgi:hypothetical protein